ncbi:hypothetical protein [Actinokineospora iranica]|uniref:hypothetical protein n=1 Tax=Actinokineospora iranica TaxID=1271860 RepID=UPI001113435D|nr:hypothetical protein [Actinokineospora iranica]
MTTPTNPFTQDKAIRPVRMTGGVALSSVLSETASQILCQVVPSDRWAQLLEGGVGRQPSLDQCSVSSDRAMLTMRLMPMGSAFSATTTVGGRPAFSVPAPATGFVVSLTDGAGSPIEKPLLSLTITSSRLDPTAQREMLTRVAAEVVPTLAKEGDPVPERDGTGRFRFVRTPAAPGGQIVDLPRPVQAAQLCTMLLETPGIPTTGAEAALTNTATCQIGVAEAKISVQSDSVRFYPDRIAGRPAKTGSTIRVRLRDDAPIDLEIRGPRQLAEALVPPLL